MWLFCHLCGEPTYLNYAVLFSGSADGKAAEKRIAEWERCHLCDNCTSKEKQKNDTALCIVLVY